MPRPRKAAVTTEAEAEPLPIRSSSRKRKLEEYAETNALTKKSGVSTTRKAGRGKSKITETTEELEVRSAPSPRTSRKTVVVKDEITNDVAEDLTNRVLDNSKRERPKPSKGKSTKAKPVEDFDASESDTDEAVEEPGPKKAVRKRKTKEEKEAEAMPLAARTSGLKMYVGAHTSIAKGVENAITNSVHIGGNAFALFLKSQRKWDNPALKNENRDAFRQHLIEHKYDGMSHVLPHGSYLVNLATEDKDKSKQSYDAFIDDLHRCEALGIGYYNFHPGSAGQAPLNEAISRLAKNLNRAIAETKTVTPVLENMASRGTIIGGRFSDLRDVIAEIKPEHRSRIGVCIDTCHAFASGYDLRSPEAFQQTLKEFDDVVGLKYLKALHLNDSKAPFASNRDLHQNIGLGFLGLRAFHNVMNEARFQNLPLILETPCEKPDPKDPTGKKTLEDKSVWAREIKLLESLIGMDPESNEFKTLEHDLSQKGKAERERMQKQFDDKVVKANKKAAKELEKGQKSLKDMFGAKGKKSKAVDDSDSAASDDD